MTDRREDAVQIARLEEKFASMHAGQLEMKAKMAQVEGKVDLIVTAVTEAKGGWKLLMIIGGMAGTVGAAFTWAVSHVGIKP